MIKYGLIMIIALYNQIKNKNKINMLKYLLIIYKISKEPIIPEKLLNYTVLNTFQIKNYKLKFISIKKVL